MRAKQPINIPRTPCTWVDEIAEAEGKLPVLVEDKKEGIMTDENKYVNILFFPAFVTLNIYFPVIPNPSFRHFKRSEES